MSELLFLYKNLFTKDHQAENAQNLRTYAKNILRLRKGEECLFWILKQKCLYHGFQFYATIGGFSSGENCVSAAVNHTIFGASSKLLYLQRILCF